MTDNEKSGTIRWSQAGGIVTLTLDDPDQSVNTMNAAYLASMGAVLERLAALGDELVGVVVTSAKPTFFAGGDLKDLVATRPGDAESLTTFVAEAKKQLRRLETLGVPVVAAVNGAALGGGLELALACHHRVALDAPTVRIGLPEVTLGLLPGGGGVVRTVRLLGLDRALDDVLLPGTAHRPAAALELGLVDELATDTDDLLARAAAWISAHPGAVQPWDDKSAPAGLPAAATPPAVRAAALRAKHKGAPMPAQTGILAAAVESTQVDVDTAFAVETRYFVELATGQISTNIIQGTFFDRQAIRSGASRPQGHATHAARTVAVLGSGLMGSGIALTAAMAGLEVRLKDVDLAGAERGLAYAQKALGKQVARGQRTESDATQVLSRIVPVADAAGLAGADLVIEAVFEDPDLKDRVLREVIDVVAPDALIATNTSTLPISGLAESVTRPEDFVGLHFFSPVERMDLLEIVVGEKTSDETLAKAFDVALQLRKTPIVVGDARGFFTSRTILSRLLEAASMLAEGVPAASIEQASLRAGYPTGTLALLDDLTCTLPHTIFGQFREDAARQGATFHDHPGAEVLGAMIEAGRPSRTAGGGFYNYVDGKRAGLWPGLDRFGPAIDPTSVVMEDLVDRLLFTEALDTARCLESGLLRSTADANVGSLLGIGYPTWTGGAAQFVAGYPGGRAAFVARANELEKRYGPQFAVPGSLVAPAERTAVGADA